MNESLYDKIKRKRRRCYNNGFEAISSSNDTTGWTTRSSNGRNDEKLISALSRDDLDKGTDIDFGKSSNSSRLDVVQETLFLSTSSPKKKKTTSGTAKKCADRTTSASPSMAKTKKKSNSTSSSSRRRKSSNATTTTTTTTTRATRTSRNSKVLTVSETEESEVLITNCDVSPRRRRRNSKNSSKDTTSISGFSTTSSSRRITRSQHQKQEWLLEDDEDSIQKQPRRSPRTKGKQKKFDTLESDSVSVSQLQQQQNDKHCSSSSSSSSSSWSSSSSSSSSSPSCSSSSSSVESSSATERNTTINPSSLSCDDEPQQPTHPSSPKRSTSTGTNTSSTTQRERRRRSSRGISSLSTLAHAIVDNKHVLFITGAGLSVNSGIQPFRGDNGLWNEVLWTNATRDAFRKDPLGWYNDFWLQYFPPSYDDDTYQPNEGHEALANLASLDLGGFAGTEVGRSNNRNNNNIRIITQNVDGLHCRTRQSWNFYDKLIEAHGRVGLYKCIPEEDSDTSSDSTEDDDEDDDEEMEILNPANNRTSTTPSKRRRRKVKLGSVRKHRIAQDKLRKQEQHKQLLHGTGTSNISHGITTKTQQQSGSNDNSSTFCDATDDEDDVVNESMRHLSIICPYQITESIQASQFLSSSVRRVLSRESKSQNDVHMAQDQDPSSNIIANDSSTSKNGPLCSKENIDNNSTAKEEGDKDGSSSKNGDEAAAATNTIVRLKEPPMCPGCLRPCLPQSLLFDEGYHSHSFYQFRRTEEWIALADVIVFVGTSFSVTITDVALKRAIEDEIPVFNFNLKERLGGGVYNTRLNVENIMGDSSETLTQLSSLVQNLLLEKQQQGIPSAAANTGDNG